MTNAPDLEPERHALSDAEDKQISDAEDMLRYDIEDKLKSDGEDTLMKSDTEHKSKSDTEDKSKVVVNKLLQLPVSRIKTIMKSSPELASVKPESYILITRATELFVTYLAKRTYEMSEGAKTIEYKSLSKVVSHDECLDFLEEIVPFKIKMKDYWDKYGYPKPEDEIEIVEIESNGSSSNGNASGSSSHQKHVLKTPNVTSSSMHNTSAKTPKSANSNNSSSLKTPKSGSSIPGKVTPGKGTPGKVTPGKVTPGKGIPVNGIPGKPHIPEVICIDD